MPIDVDDPQSTRQVFFRTRLFVQAAFACDEVEGITSLTYASVDPEVIDSFFFLYRQFSDVPDGEDCPGDSTYSAGKGDQRRTVGVYACFTVDAGTPNEAAHIRWIHRRLGFYGGAEIVGGTFDDVYRFWAKESGPV